MNTLFLQYVWKPDHTCKTYRFWSVQSLFSLWVKMCSKTEIARSDWTYTSFCSGRMENHPTIKRRLSCNRLVLKITIFYLLNDSKSCFMILECGHPLLPRFMIGSGSTWSHHSQSQSILFDLPQLLAWCAYLNLKITWSSKPSQPLHILSTRYFSVESFITVFYSSTW